MGVGGGVVVVGGGDSKPTQRTLSRLARTVRPAGRGQPLPSFGLGTVVARHGEAQGLEGVPRGCNAV